MNDLNLKFEEGVRFLVKYIGPSNKDSRKPILFHDIRVGVYLYENGYSEKIVLAGLLHDTIEWSSADEQLIRKEFGADVTQLVLACTKNDSISDKEVKTIELIERCAQDGENALIVKAADIIDSFKWYASQNNEDGLRYCLRNAKAIFKYKPNDYQDKIFDELETWQNKFSYLIV